MNAVLVIESEEWVMLSDIAWSTTEHLDNPRALRRVAEAYVGYPMYGDKFTSWKAQLVLLFLDPPHGMVAGIAHSDPEKDVQTSTILRPPTR